MSLRIATFNLENLVTLSRFPVLSTQVILDGDGPRPAYRMATADSLIAIAGDFNAEADEVAVRAICGPVEETGNPARAPRVMVPCENNVPESSRYSLLHLGRGYMLDHILVSRPLLGLFRGTEIHNEALPDESGAFRQDVNFPESDHAPVVAQFELT